MKHTLNTSGFSLLQVIVVLAVIAAAIPAFIKMFDTLFRAQRHIEMKGDLESLRQKVRMELDCMKTVPDPATVCQNLQYPPILRKDGSPLIPGNDEMGVKLGEFNLRAVCKPNSIELERAVPRTAATFLLDPLTRQPLSWTPLFKSGAAICSERFIANSNESFTSVTLSHLLIPFADIENPNAGTSVPIGSIVYHTKGTKLLISTSTKIGARGSGRGSFVEFSVFDLNVGNTIYSDQEQHFLYGNTNGQTLAARVQRESMMDVAPEHDYRITFSLRSTESGSSQTVNGFAPCSMVSDGIELLIKDYSY